MKKHVLYGLVFLISFVICNYSFAEYNSFDNANSGPPQWGPTELKDVNLQWLPNDPVTSLDPIDITVFKKKRIMIGTITDSRKNQTEIGKNIEKKWNDKDLVVTTKDNVSKWLADRFIQLFSDFEIPVIKDNPDVIIEGDIIKYYVTEKSTYKTDVALNIKIKSKDGKLLWEGMVAGRSSKFGASYKENNYQEGLSNATIDLVYSLLKNEQIKQIMK